MNREIKFRAWDKSKDKFVSPYNQPIIGSAVGDLKWSLEPNNVPIVFMQFIGRKDKNGNEIYEGDIVLCDDNGEQFGQEYDEDKDEYFSTDKYEVYWENDCGGYYLRGFEGDEGIAWSMIEFEVIGNIYENPELVAPKNPKNNPMLQDDILNAMPQKRELINGDYRDMTNKGFNAAIKQTKENLSSLNLNQYVKVEEVLALFEDFVGDENKIATKLYFAWEKYTELFGERPHGTLMQMKALIELSELSAAQEKLKEVLA